jgi:RimJ/RimL family protein N-acetyltransferase
VTVNLRPQLPEDLPLLTGGHSPFDDFGPRARDASPAPCKLDGTGGLAIVTEDGQLAGDLGWHWRQWGPTTGSHCPMIGIWLRPEYRGRGIGRDAQAQIVELFFRHTTTNRVEAHTDIENAAEQRALEAAGFRREGIVRGAQWRDGTHHDGVLYAVLRSDPRPSARGAGKHD